GCGAAPTLLQIVGPHPGHRAIGAEHDEGLTRAQEPDLDGMRRPLNRSPSEEVARVLTSESMTPTGVIRSIDSDPERLFCRWEHDMSQQRRHDFRRANGA